MSKEHIMPYSIRVYVNNDTDETLDVIELSTYGRGHWAGLARSNALRLELPSSGCFGMLHFKSSSELFAVAVGVHDYQAWLDVKYDLSDRERLARMQAKYYEATTEGKARDKVESSTACRTTRGKHVMAAFYKTSGRNLGVTITYANSRED